MGDIFEAIFKCDAAQGDLFFERLHLEWRRFSCVLTLFWKQYNISMPCQVFCLFFERLHHEQCSVMCVDFVFEAIQHFHDTPGDLFVFRTIASRTAQVHVC